MAKLFQPIRFWMARFTCRKSSASSSSSCPSRPSSGLQPATIRWRAFVRRPSGRPASTKRTSATVARRSPVSYAPRPRSRLGIPARLRGPGKASVRLGCISLPPACVATAPRRLRPLVFARLPPRPGNGENAAGFLPLPRQPAAARHRSRLSLSASGTALPNQAGLVLTNIFAMSIGVNRPSLRHAGSRLFFYLPRLLPVEQPPPPSAGTGRCWGAPHPNKFLPIHWPIRQ